MNSYLGFVGDEGFGLVEVNANIVLDVVCLDTFLHDYGSFIPDDPPYIFVIEGL